MTTPSRSPTYDGIDLVLDDRSPSGAAFDLDPRPRDDRKISVDGWTISIQSKASVLVATGGTATAFDSALASGIERAEEALDRFSVRGLDQLYLTNPDDHITWWSEATGLIIRRTSLALQPLPEFSVTASVVDAAGVVVAQLPPPEPDWHPSFRYFRLSQTSDDLFDAYRNVYLALESVLSEIRPQRKLPSGYWETEGRWLREALAAANGRVSLAPFVEIGQDPVETLHRELYQELRSGLFHAKVGREVVLPRTQAKRPIIEARLWRVGRIYAALAEHTFGARFLGSGMTAYATREMFEAVLAESTIIASDDESVPNPDRSTLARGRNDVQLRTVGVYDPEPFVVVCQAEASGDRFADLPFIRRLTTVMATGQIAMTDRFNARLKIGSAARFEVVAGARGFNKRDVRTRYPR